MRFFSSLPVLLLLSVNLKAQGPVGSWKDHLSYCSALTIAIGPDEIYASTGSSLLIFNKKYSELRKASTVQGLTETGISTIRWSDEKKILIIAYYSTNIDIVSGHNIYNIPDIKKKYFPGKKEIYKIRTLGKYAYLASSLGIIVLDLVKMEIYDTWKPGGEGIEVYDVAFNGTIVYAATNSGLFYSDITTGGQVYPGNWYRVNSFPSQFASFNAVISLNNKIYVNLMSNTDTDTIFSVSNSQEVNIFSVQSNLKNISLEAFSEGFIVASRSMVRVYNNDGLLTSAISSYNSGSPDIAHAMADGKDIWIADRSNGMIKYSGSGGFTKFSLPGPSTNNVLFITNSNNKTYISGGALDNAWNNQWRPLQIFIHENDTWHCELSNDLHDPLRILPDPFNPDHFWVSTWGEGLLEYEKNNLIKKYDYTNSPLQTIIPGKPYTRICGLAMDRNKNIWITQTEVPGSIKVLKEDRTWTVFPVTINAETIGDIIITSTGQKWITLPRGYGLFVLDDNGTIDDFNDDRYKQFLIRDNDNNILSNVYCIAEDLEGNIWVGTDQGPAVYYNPSRIFDEDITAVRIKIPRNDGSGLADYMLGTEIISCIAVDGGNRKWLGTYNSGAHLISADGANELINYNEENSPLYSNMVVSIAIDGRTGEIWFGTSKGVISVRGDATTGAEKFSNVYAFPNPIRENYNGVLTIKGLMRNTSVKITDVSGNLVYKTMSQGGQATWDLKTYTGEKVSTGVYIILCASENGKETAVTKVLVIK